MAAAGQYKCTTADDETVCDLIVYLKNAVKKQLEDKTVDEGENALFECQMVDKEAKVVWYHKGER